MLMPGLYRRLSASATPARPDNPGVAGGEQHAGVAKLARLPSPIGEQLRHHPPPQSGCHHGGTTALSIKPLQRPPFRKVLARRVLPGAILAGKKETDALATRLAESLVTIESAQARFPPISGGSRG